MTTPFLSERLRGEGKALNAFGGYEELQQLLDEAADRLEYLEYRRLHMNSLVAQIRDMNRDLGHSMSAIADQLTEIVI